MAKSELDINVFLQISSEKNFINKFSGTAAGLVVTDHTLTEKSGLDVDHMPPPLLKCP